MIWGVILFGGGFAAGFFAGVFFAAWKVWEYRGAEGNDAD